MLAGRHKNGSEPDSRIVARGSTLQRSPFWPASPGFVFEHCTRYLRPVGWLLVNPSHGDVAMASINPEYSLRQS